MTKIEGIFDMARRITQPVSVGNVVVGGNAPIINDSIVRKVQCPGEPNRISIPAT